MRGERVLKNRSRLFAPSPGGFFRAAHLIALTLFMSACAARGFVPPREPGTPAPDAAQVFANATDACASLEGLTAEAALSGRVEGRSVRGRLHLGLTRAGQIRLEAVAPFGQPIFTLAGDRERATLFLPRDGHVLRDAAPAKILEALAGVALSPDELLRIATGCLGAGEQVTRAERFSSGLVRISTERGVDVWAKPSASPRPVAVMRGDLWAEYLKYEGDGPVDVRLARRDSSGKPFVDLRLSFSQRERNPQLQPAAFRVEVPADARSMSLEELRERGFLK